MKRSHLAALTAITLAGTAAIAGCGGSSGGSSTSAAPTGTIACIDGSIKAAGSTAQANAITEWINAYQTACPGATIDYQAVGSGAGVEQFTAKQTSFAGTDSAVSGDDLTAANDRCATGPALNIPMVGGAIAIAFNVPGVDSLTLDPATLAGIFNSSITKWNDPKIAALNAGVSLPDASIAQFHRSDSSGTTDNFTKYLAATAPDVWTFEPGKDWVAPGGQGAKGSDQVIAQVQNTPNSIGYAELSFVLSATAAKAAKIDNGAGPVEPSSDTAANAIAKATFVGSGDDLALKLDYTLKDANAYPIVLVTYEVVCQKGLAADQNPALVKSFLTYTASDAGQALLSEVGYVPIKGDLLTRVRSAVASLATS